MKNEQKNETLQIRKFLIISIELVELNIVLRDLHAIVYVKKVIRFWKSQFSIFYVFFFRTRPEKFRACINMDRKLQGESNDVIAYSIAALELEL